MTLSLLNNLIRPRINPNDALRDAAEAGMKRIMENSGRIYTPTTHNAFPIFIPGNQQETQTDLPPIQPLKPSDPITPLNQIAEDVSKVAKETLLPAQIVEPNVSQTAVSTSMKAGLFTIPLFLLWLNSGNEKKEIVIQDANLLIDAPQHPRVYEIGLGTKGQKEASIAFYVKAGEAVRVYNRNRLIEDDVDSSDESASPLMQDDLSTEQYTNCTVIVRDPGNPHLQNGPLGGYVRLSGREGIKIVHLDPYVTPNISNINDSTEEIDASQNIHFKSVKAKISDPISWIDPFRRQEIPLSCDEYGNVQKNQYVSVTQYI